MDIEGGVGRDDGHGEARDVAGGEPKADSVRKRLSVQRTGSLLQYRPEATHVSDLQQDDGGLCSIRQVDGQNVAGNEIYFLGIVDFLQRYNLRKLAETNFKSLRYKRLELSAVPPEAYARRFHAFMTAIIE